MEVLYPRLVLLFSPTKRRINWLNNKHFAFKNIFPAIYYAREHFATIKGSVGTTPTAIGVKVEQAHFFLYSSMRQTLLQQNSRIKR